MMKPRTSPDTKKKTRILFKVIGSPDIGLGHVMRSMELAREFEKKPDTEIFFYCNQNDIVISKLFGNFRFFSEDPGDLKNKKILNLIHKYNFEIVIIDHLGADPALCSAIKSHKPETLIVALDSFNYADNSIDIIINLFNHNLEISNPRYRFSGQYYEGLQYAIIRDLFLPIIKKKRRIASTLDNILISYGSADKKHHTLNAIKLLETVCRDVDFYVIVGALNRDYDVIMRTSKNNPRYKIYCDIPNIQELMDRADAGFVGSGTTLLELCSLGVPSVVTPQNEFEERFSEYIKKNNACLVLHEAEIQQPENELLIKSLTDPKIRQNMSKNQKKLIDGRGKERIVHLVLSGQELL